MKRLVISLCLSIAAINGATAMSDARRERLLYLHMLATECGAKTDPADFARLADDPHARSYLAKFYPDNRIDRSRGPTDLAAVCPIAIANARMFDLVKN